MNEIRNDFIWDLTEEDWKKYPKEIQNNLESYGCYNTAGVVGNCWIGELCFDFRAWGDETGAAFGYELYVGGVNGHNETEDGYPYDLIEEFGEFDLGILDLSVDKFKEIAEPLLKQFILKANHDYKPADLVEKANAKTIKF